MDINLYGYIHHIITSLYTIPYKHSHWKFSCTSTITDSWISVKQMFPNRQLLPQHQTWTYQNTHHMYTSPSHELASLLNASRILTPQTVALVSRNHSDSSSSSQTAIYAEVLVASDYEQLANALWVPVFTGVEQLAHMGLITAYLSPEVLNVCCHWRIL